MPVLTGNDLPNTALDSTSTIVFPKHYPGNQHIPTQSSLFYIRSQRGRPGPTIPIWEIILFVWLTLSPTHCDDAQLVNLTISTQQKWNLWSPHLKWDTSVTDRGIVLTSISQLTHSRLGMISMLQRLEMVRTEPAGTSNWTNSQCQTFCFLSQSIQLQPIFYQNKISLPLSPPSASETYLAGWEWSECWSLRSLNVCLTKGWLAGVKCVWGMTGSGHHWGLEWNIYICREYSSLDNRACSVGTSSAESPRRMFVTWEMEWWGERRGETTRSPWRPPWRPLGCCWASS